MSAEEWKRNSIGQRYRQIGNVTEYAPTVVTSEGEVYQDTVEETLRRLKHSNKQDQKEMTGRICPFRDAVERGQKECVRDCAFYAEAGCLLSGSSGRETKGKSCPFRRTCDEKCALYCNGCALNLKGRE